MQSGGHISHPATKPFRSDNGLQLWPLLLLLFAIGVTSISSFAWPSEFGPANPDWVKARKSKGEEALGIYQSLVREHPEQAALYYELGLVQYDLSRFEQAITSFQKAREGHLKTVPLLIALGKAYAKLKKHAEAESVFQEAFGNDPGERLHVVQFNLGEALFYQGKPSEALVWFRKLEERNDQWGQHAREYLAYCYFDLHQYTEALRMVSPMVEKAPQDKNLRWLLARSLYKAKRYEEALPHLKKVAEEDSVRAEAAGYYMAACLEGLGQKWEAEHAYHRISDGNSEWSHAAHEAARSLAGKPYRIFLDFLSGYDTGLLQPGDESVSVGGKDAFTQQYALFEGRVFRNQLFQLWLGGEHFGIHYPELHSNDYFEDTGSASFIFPDVGVFSEISVKYHFKYAQLDYQSYLREHQVTLQNTYKHDSGLLRFGAYYGQNDYFRLSQGLTGPDARVFFDYKRDLPLWDHSVQLRANVDYRWAALESSQRFAQRVRLKYEADLSNRVSAFVEGTYRRDDYPESQSGEFFLKLRHRTDHRLKGEVRFEYSVNRHLFFNWGYSYESQDSRREEQEYGRHQIDAGFTISF